MDAPFSYRTALYGACASTKQVRNRCPITISICCPIWSIKFLGRNPNRCPQYCEQATKYVSSIRWLQALPQPRRTHLRSKHSRKKTGAGHPRRFLGFSAVEFGRSDGFDRSDASDKHTPVDLLRLHAPPLCPAIRGYLRWVTACYSPVGTKSTLREVARLVRQPAPEPDEYFPDSRNMTFCPLLTEKAYANVKSWFILVPLS